MFLVTNVNLHEDYVPSDFLPEQDLAILELDRDVQVSDWIYPICTPGFYDYYANNTAEVVGKVNHNTYCVWAVPGCFFLFQDGV